MIFERGFKKNLEKATRKISVCSGPVHPNAAQRLWLKMNMYMVEPQEMKMKPIL